MKKKLLNRRDAIKNTAIISSGIITSIASDSRSINSPAKKLKGKVNHSACRWCYADIPLEQLAEVAQEIGLKSIELLNPEEWHYMIDRGLTCAISNGSKLGITKGFNNPLYHSKLLIDYKNIIPLAADHGIGQVICFSGNRNGLTDEEGLENCARGLEPVLKLAEKYKVKIVMELLNSKVDHADYMCDFTSWGVALSEKIGSPNFKLLYDIYHMQIMEGNVISTIKKNINYISHFHTGGVPGRNEIDASQELNYTAIIEAIYSLGFEGYVAQEFIPTRKDPFESLREGVKICDV